MADIKISELGAASAVNATDLFPVTSNGVTVKATAQQIKNYIGVGNLANLNTTDKSSAVTAINEVNTKVSKTEDLIAYVQTTLTASKAYAVGEQFIYNGLLYKATAAIAQGGKITIGGNCKLADSVTEQINDIIKNKIPSVTYGSIRTGIAYKKYGNIVILTFALSISPANTEVELATLPNDLKPNTWFRSTLVTDEGDKVCRVAVNTTKIFARTSYVSTYFGELVYLV